MILDETPSPQRLPAEPPTVSPERLRPQYKANERLARARRLVQLLRGGRK